METSTSRPITWTRFTVLVFGGMFALVAAWSGLQWLADQQWVGMVVQMALVIPVVVFLACAVVSGLFSAR